MSLGDIQFVTARCTWVPRGHLVVYRWPGPNRFNVLGNPQPTRDQAIAAINAFLEKEQEKSNANFNEGSATSQSRSL